MYVWGGEEGGDGRAAIIMVVAGGQKRHVMSAVRGERERERVGRG